MLAEQEDPPQPPPHPRKEKEKLKKKRAQRISLPLNETTPCDVALLIEDLANLWSKHLHIHTYVLCAMNKVIVLGRTRSFSER